MSTRPEGISSRRYALRKAVHGVGLLAVLLASAEVAARVEGWINYGEPLLGAPNMDSALWVQDARGTRGKPYGRYLDYRLNRHGFRGPDVGKDRSPGILRVMVISASEGFGTGLAEGNDFPARLGRILETHGSYEVINASIVGMTARSMTGFWEDWAAGFRPDVVVVYPNAVFYLNNMTPPPPTPRLNNTTPPPPPPPPPRWGFLPRIIVRLRSSFVFPRWFEGWRDRRSIDRILSSKPTGWAFSSVPRDRLEWFIEDLGRLTDSVKALGAIPVVMTHPIRAASLDRPGDLHDLRHWRTMYPRGTESLFLEFSKEANREVLDFGRSRGVDVIDLAAGLDANRDAFIDLVHFSDRGSRAAAECVAEYIAKHFPSPRRSPLAAKD